MHQPFITSTIDLINLATTPPHYLYNIIIKQEPVSVALDNSDVMPSVGTTNVNDINIYESDHTHSNIT